MKKSLFILLFVATTTCLFGQTKPDKIETVGNRRVEIYYYHKTVYDSMRFTIQGKTDTVLTEKIARNGKCRERSWAEDSVYQFNNQGLIERKSFQLKPNEQADSLIEFYPNGQINFCSVREKGVFGHYKRFKENGTLKFQEDTKNIGKSGLYTVSRDGSNRVYQALFTDTVFINEKPFITCFDTVFYTNGQAFFISIEKAGKGYVSRRFYDEKGQIIESITPDSLRLTAFKDNVDCHYGLKTAKGDTIFTPRFDHIKQLDANLLVVFEGTKCRLMRPDGTFIAAPDMNDIEPFSESVLSPDDKKHKAEWERLKLNRFCHLLRFTVGNQYGVMNRAGQIIVPPQYRALEMGYRSVENDSLFEFKVTKIDSSNYHQTVELGYVKPDGTSLLPDYIYAQLINGSKDYFKVSHSPLSFKYTSNNVYGLVKNGELLLPCVFSDIEPMGENDLFFTAFNKDIDNKNVKISGIFDAKKRRWLIDTSGRLVFDRYRSCTNGVLVYDKKTKKHGLLGVNGAFSIPLIYDSLSLAHDKQALFIGRTGNNYQFISLGNKRKRPVYEFLDDVSFHYDFLYQSTVTVPVYLAKKGGKWGIVDSNDRILHPFTADYAANYMSNGKVKLILVQNNKVHYFDYNSFPNEGDVTSFFNTRATGLVSAPLADQRDKLFFFNAQGQIVIPPQYQSVMQDGYYSREDIGGYFFVEDAQKKRKLIAAETGAVLDFPFDYNIEVADTSCKIIIVKDTKQKKTSSWFPQNVGVVSTDGRVLTPCINSGVALADTKTGSYFVKRDTPVLQEGRIFWDLDLAKLNEADTNWLWYNANGQLLDTKPFRYPINFKDGIGVGMQGEKFGLYRSDGSIIAPPSRGIGMQAQYANIRRDENTNLYYLIDIQGLTVTSSIRKSNGNLLVESGQYDGISSFYGKYALTLQGEKVGLIDSLGKEIIAPQDLRTYNGANLVDSISFFNKELEAKAALEKDSKRKELLYQQRLLPIEIFGYIFTRGNIKDPDSLDLSPALYNSFWHLVLDKVKKNTMWQTTDIKINRSKRHAAPYYTEQRSCGRGEPTDDELHFHQIFGATTGKNTLSFILYANTRFRYGSSFPVFYNFYQKNNRWEELKINDILNLQAEKRWTFNDLLTQKVKAMKDEEINCSDASAFLTKVEERFMLTKDGLDFCFDSEKSQYSFAVVSFSWAELEGYLKMRF